MLYTYAMFSPSLEGGVVNAVREIRKAYWVDFYPWISWRYHD